MIFSMRLSSLVLVLVTTLPALGQLSKPVMNPAVPFHNLDPILYQHLPHTPWWRDSWGWGWLPLRCKVVAEQRGLNPYDVEVYNVHYDDCGQTWVMCRHHNAEVSIDEMAENFGRLPVRMRNFIRHQFAVPGKGDGSFGGLAYSDLGDVIFHGNVGQYVRVWVHEAAHAIDWNIDPFDTDYSASTAWLQEYNKDPFIADTYAQTNHAENFAQEVIVALFDKVVPGGIGTVSPNWNDIFHQYATVQAKLGDILVPGGTCNRRFADDAIVCMGPAAGCAGLRNGTETADASLAEASLQPPIEDDFSEHL